MANLFWLWLGGVSVWMGGVLVGWALREIAVNQSDRKELQ